MRGNTEEPGIIPLAVAEIFRQIDSMQDREFLLRVSYMEVSVASSTVSLKHIMNLFDWQAEKDV